MGGGGGSTFQMLTVREVELQFCHFMCLTSNCSTHAGHLILNAIKYMYTLTFTEPNCVLLFYSLKSLAGEKILTTPKWPLKQVR